MTHRFLADRTARSNDRLLAWNCRLSIWRLSVCAKVYCG